MVNKQGNKDERRLAIMQAAYHLFGRVGYVKATMKDIAAEAGVAQGLIGYHFGTKEALLVAVVREWMINRGMKDAFSKFDLTQSPEQLLHNALSHVVQFRKANPEWFTLLVSLYLESLHNKDLAKELHDIYKEMKLGVLQIVHCLGLDLSEEQKHILTSAVQAVFDGLTLQNVFEEEGSAFYSKSLFSTMDWLVKGTTSKLNKGGEE